jgi:hypothetical protein
MINQEGQISTKELEFYGSIPQMRNTLLSQDKIAAFDVTNLIFNKQSKVFIEQIVVQNLVDLKKITALLQQNIDYNKIMQQFKLSKPGLWLDFNDLNEKYQSVLKNMSVGMISEPFQMDDEIIILKLIDVKHVTIKSHKQNPQYLELNYNDKIKLLLQNFKNTLIANSYIHQLKHNYTILKYA